MRLFLALIDLIQLAPCPFWFAGLLALIYCSPVGASLPFAVDHTVVGAQIWGLSCLAGLAASLVVGLVNASLGEVTGDARRWALVCLFFPPVGTARWFAHTRGRLVEEFGVVPAPVVQVRPRPQRPAARAPTRSVAVLPVPRPPVKTRPPSAEAARRAPTGPPVPLSAAVARPIEPVVDVAVAEPREAEPQEAGPGEAEPVALEEATELDMRAVVGELTQREDVLELRAAGIRAPLPGVLVGSMGGGAYVGV